MKKFRDYSFSNQLVVYAILISLIMAGGITAVGIWQIKIVLKKQALINLESAAKKQINKINTYFDNFERSSDFYCGSAFMQKYINGYGQDSLTSGKIDFDAYSKHFLESYTLEDIKIFTRKGTEIYSVFNAGSLGFPQPYDRNEKEFNFEMPYMENGQYFVNAYTTVSGTSNLMYIGYKLNLKEIYNSLNDTTELGKTGEVLLGINSDSMATFINPLRFDPKAAFTRTADFKSKSAIPIINAVSKIEGSGESVDYRKAKVLAVWRHIDRFNWGLVAKIDIDEVMEPVSMLRMKVILFAALITLFSVVIAILFSKATVKSINKLREVITNLSEGKIVRNVNIQRNQDEIGQMTKAALELAEFQNNIIEFTTNISSKNFEKNDSIDIARGEIGAALTEMSANLQKVEKEDKLRSWSNEGIAKFSTIIRDFSNDSKKLSSVLISELVQYMDSNQGGLYILSDDREKLTQLAFYAYDREKFSEDYLIKGEGVNWQAIMEKSTIHLNDVPDDYINITSGLGEAVPRSILIVPLLINEEVYGVIELASFQKYEDYQIEFVEKIAESVAGAISNITVNEKTKELLENSQLKTQELTAQEEEMRQNMEEMQATQEEMVRIQKEIMEKEAILTSVMDQNENQTYFCIDRNYRIVVINKVLQERTKKDGNELEVGKNIFDCISEENHAFWKEIYDDILAGKASEKIQERTLPDRTLTLKAIYKPIFNENKEVIAASVLSIDITKEIEMEKEILELKKRLKDLES